MEMENGTRAFYEGNQCSATTLNGWTQDYFRAECDQATLVLDNRRLSVMSELSGKRETTVVPLLEKNVWRNSYLAELFLHWIHGGEEPLNTLEDNIQCTALLFAAVASARSGQVVDVQEFLHHHLDTDSLEK